MGYEVDFLGVGSESKSGDAIAIRFGNLHGPRDEQTVVIIDGGFKDSGQDVIDHVKSHFNTRKVDLVISTHPDQDHINGLETVLEELDVGELWMHQPWNHNAGLGEKFVDGRVSDNSIGERLKKNLEKAFDLLKLAERKGVEVSEPFTGLTYGAGEIKILGPSEHYYCELIPEFDGMPATVDESSKSLGGLFETALDAIKKFFATWGQDELDNNDDTSAKNNSSVITQIIADGRRMVFTGDAGVTALDYAADELDACMLNAELKFIQIPHHGSRRNVGPLVLDRIIGPAIQQGESRGIMAFASTAKNGEPKHPRKSVLNAFTHRGAEVVATRGYGKRHSYNAPERENWSSVDAEPYHWEYEE